MTAATRHVGFMMGSPELTGELLCTLAASKPGGKLLELGTGTGLATAWLLHGMSPDATLLSVDNDAEAVAVARTHLGNDTRLELKTGDGFELLRELKSEAFDLIFADTWPGKIHAPELALDLVSPGGFYVVDDMELAWATNKNLLDDTLLGVWEGQRRLMSLLETRTDFLCTSMNWSTGLIVYTKLSR